MKKISLKESTVADLLKTYVIAASAHGNAIASGNYRAANANHDIVAAAYRELRTRGIEEQRKILGLLDHPDESVRGWAASHALEFAPDEGRVVLEVIAKGEGIRALAAETTLIEWRQGTLKFP